MELVTNFPNVPSVSCKVYKRGVELCRIYFLSFSVRVKVMLKFMIHANPIKLFFDRAKFSMKARFRETGKGYFLISFVAVLLVSLSR